jgi:hypothetical protein
MEKLIKVFIAGVAVVLSLSIFGVFGGILIVGCVVKKGVEVSKSEEFQQKGLKGVINKTWEGSSTNNVSE